MQHPPKKQIKRFSPKRAAWLAMAAVVLSAAFVLLIPLIRQAFPASKPVYEVKQSTVRTIGSRSAEQIESITIFPDGRNSYTLYLREGQLMLERAGEMKPISQNYQTQILDTVTEIAVQNTVSENAADAAQEWGAMGLENPQCSAVIRYTDGSEETMEVGAMAHGSAEYYFRWSGAPGIYLCHSGVAETLTLDEKLLLPFSQISIISSLVEELHIQNAAGGCSFSFENEQGGMLTAPCRYPLNDDTAQTLLSVLAQFRLGSYEAPLSRENSAFYGLDDPICILEIRQKEGLAHTIAEDGSLATVQQPAQAFRFVIGRAEGEFFYTCAYQENVYFISRFLVESLVQADWKQLISRTPAAMGDQLLSHIVFETPDAVTEVKAMRTESVLANNQLETDAEGNPVYLTSVTVNGQEVPQEKLEILQDALNAFSVEGEIPPDAQPEEEPRWRMTLVAENGTVRVLEGYRLDRFSDAVAVNGVICHYVYDGAIDVLMAGLV